MNKEYVKASSFITPDKNQKSIEIPEGVEEIDSKLFNDYKLRFVKLPSTLKKIGDSSFALCYNLRKIEIPEGTADIERSAFRDCRSIKEINLPTSLTELSDAIFEGCSSLKRIIIPSKVTKIGMYSFERCSRLEEVVVGEEQQWPYNSSNLESIDNFAFFRCESLKTVKLNETLRYIGSEAFCCCTSLEEIDLPYTVTIIGDSCFSSCSNLRKIIIPKGVHGIEKNTFKGCRRLKEVTLQEGLTYIEKGAFFDCKELNTLHLPSTIKKIGESAFSGCVSLKTINLPEGLESIDDFAFENCRNLVSLKLPSTLKKIGDKVFFYCESIEKISIPVDLEIKKDSLSGMPSLNEIIVNYNDFNQLYNFVSKNKEAINQLYEEKGPKILSFIGPQLNRLEVFKLQNIISNNVYNISTELKEEIQEEIPTTPVEENNHAFFIKKIRKPITKRKYVKASSFITPNEEQKSVQIPEGVEEIDSSFFEDNQKLDSIAFPSTLKRIGDYSFKSCVGLEELKMPDALAEIDDAAFSHCTSIRSVTLPDSLKLLGRSSFINCTSLESIEIPGGVKTISDRCFSRCIALKTVTLNEGLVSIEHGSFSHCESLEEIVIPNTVTKIGKISFANCSNLKKIVLSEGLREIGEDAFCGCNSLEEIVIPYTVTKIGDSCFSRCSNLRRIVLPYNIQEIGKQAFNSCDKLSTIIIPGSLKTLTEKTFNESRFREITLGEGIENIEKYAFCDCKELNHVNLPTTLKRIGESAFSGCVELNSIDLPEGLIIIKDSAFKDCKNLTSIKLPSTLKMLDSTAFSGCESIEKMIFPIGLRINKDTINSMPSLNEIIVIYDDFNQLYNFVSNNKEVLNQLYEEKGPKILSFVGPQLNRFESIKLGILFNSNAYNVEPELKKELLEEKKTPIVKNIPSYTGDQEIDTIINNIYNKITFLPSNIKDMISKKVNEVIKEYEKAKNELKPSIDDDMNSIELQIGSPLTRRLDIVSKLKTILFSITDLEYYNKILEQVESYFELINGISIKPLEDDYISEDILNILNAISELSKSYQTIIIDDLETTLCNFKSKINQRISKNITNQNNEDYRTQLAIEICKINKRVETDLKTLHQYLVLKEALEGTTAKRYGDETVNNIYLARSLIKFLPPGDFKQEIQKSFKELLDECTNIVEKAIENDECFTLDKYNEITFKITNQLTIIATRINEFNQLRKIEIQKEALTPTPVTSVNNLNALENMLDRCIRFLKGEINDYLMLNRKGVEGVIINYYYSVIRNQNLTEEDKGKLINRLIGALNNHLEKAKRGKCTPNNNYLINEILDVISSLNDITRNYISQKKDYDLAFNPGKKM